MFLTGDGVGFKKGNTFGKGRPSNGHAQLFRDLVIDDIPDLVKDIMKDAKGGCQASRKLIIDRIFPLVTLQTSMIQNDIDVRKEMIEDEK